MNDQCTYLSTRRAAEYLGLSARTLDRYRVSGDGPVFHRFGGRVRYACADLDLRRRHRARGRGPMSGRAGRARMQHAVAAVAAAALPAAMLMGADPAWAASDTTFSGALGTVTGIVSGTGGRLAGALALGAALVGSVLRFNAIQLLGAVGVGIVAGAGTGIMAGLVGTAIV